MFSKRYRLSVGIVALVSFSFLFSLVSARQRPLVGFTGENMPACGFSETNSNRQDSNMPVQACEFPLLSSATSNLTAQSEPKLTGKIVFTRASSSQSSSDGSGDLYTMNADGSDLQRLTTGLEGYEPAWSPDGQQIVFSNFVDQRRKLFVINADGTNPHQITDMQNAAEPKWSPDGQNILFNATLKTGNDGVFVIAADGSAQPYALTAGDEECLWPEWSPDGQFIVFIKRDAQTLYHLFVMDANGVYQTEIGTPKNTDDSYFKPLWMPDGQHIIYLIKNKLFSVTPDGRNTQELASTAELIDSELVFSPDGNFVAFSNTTQEMFALALDGSNSLIKLGVGNSPGWSTNSEIFVAFRNMT